MSKRDMVLCSNTYCPRSQEVEIPLDLRQRQIVNLLAISRYDALCDTEGNYWCKRCEFRCQLMNWGKSHKWPAINCPPYAVAQGQMFWELAVKLGIDAYAQALADAVLIAEEV